MILRYVEMIYLYIYINYIYDSVKLLSKCFVQYLHVKCLFILTAFVNIEKYQNKAQLIILFYPKCTYVNTSFKYKRICVICSEYW